MLVEIVRVLQEKFFSWYLQIVDLLFVVFEFEDEAHQFCVVLVLLFV